MNEQKSFSKQGSRIIRRSQIVFLVGLLVWIAIVTIIFLVYQQRTDRVRFANETRIANAFATQTETQLAPSRTQDQIATFDGLTQIARNDLGSTAIVIEQTRFVQTQTRAAANDFAAQTLTRLAVTSTLTPSLTYTSTMTVTRTYTPTPTSTQTPLSSLCATQVRDLSRVHLYPSDSFPPLPAEGRSITEEFEILGSFEDGSWYLLQLPDQSAKVWSRPNNLRTLVNCPSRPLNNLALANYRQDETLWFYDVFHDNRNGWQMAGNQTEQIAIEGNTESDTSLFLREPGEQLISALRTDLDITHMPDNYRIDLVALIEERGVNAPRFGMRLNVQANSYIQFTISSAVGGICSILLEEVTISDGRRNVATLIRDQLDSDCNFVADDGTEYEVLISLEKRNREFTLTINQIKTLSGTSNTDFRGGAFNLISISTGNSVVPSPMRFYQLFIWDLSQ